MARMINPAAAAAAAYGAARRTLSPLHVVVEFYDAALTAVAHAGRAKSMSDPEREFQALTEAARILQALDSCLARKDLQAKPMAETLHAYYRSVIAQLHAAKMTRGPAGLARYASVHRQLLTMREAWAELAGVRSLTVPPRQDLPGEGHILPSAAQNVPADQGLSPLTRSSHVTQRHEHAFEPRDLRRLL